MVAVTASGFDERGGVNVIFWMSARLGETDTTAKLVRAGAKWLVPGLVSYTDGARRAGLAGCGSVGVWFRPGCGSLERVVLAPGWIG